MAEIDVTRLVEETEAFEFSASIAERGQNAGRETWNNAKAEAKDNPILTTEEDLQALRDHVRGFGAWEEEEIAAWSADECNALLIQMVAGDFRTAESLCPGDGPGGVDWQAYEKLAEQGTCSGSIFASGDKVFYYLGD
jgi:hypothetical protein